MVGTSFTFRLDSFAADYDAAIQLSEAQEPSVGVDVTVEVDRRATTEAEAFKGFTGRD